eukprot:gene20444-25059_t
MTQELRTQRDELVSASDVIDSRRRFIEAVLSSASAGIIGVACALQLARQGRRVVVIDAQPPGMGASYGNAGQPRPGHAGASAISHDLYASVLKKGTATEAQEMRVTRIATVCLGIVAIGLGILFEKQNVAFLVGLTFGIAASTNFPVLIMAMYWKNLTTRGALAGGFV